MSTPNKYRLGMAVVVLLASTTAALAGSLTIVDVNAPAVNCVFDTTCALTVRDSAGNIAIPNGPGFDTGVLQSRTFAGAAGAPGAGKTGYEYRLDMTQVAGSFECIAGAVINFGPVTKLPYTGGPMADVYVITSGGLGTIGLSSAEQDGDVITFQFDKLLCWTGTQNPANTTFFFGLASAAVPMPITAGLFGIGDPPYRAVAARAPTH